MPNLLSSAEISHSLEKTDIVMLLQEDEMNEALYEAADRVRKAYVGDEVYLQVLIGVSSICHQNCMHCSLRRDNSIVKRYRLEAERVLELVKKAGADGCKTVVLQSGEDKYYTVEKLQDTIYKVKNMDISVTLSIGERTREEYQAFKEAGADRFLLPIETTDKKLYDVLNPGMSFLNRLRCLKDLKEMGYEVGSGCVVGLPNQSLTSLAEDMLFFKEFAAETVVIEPFIPCNNTPLFCGNGGAFTLSRKLMAIARLLLPNANIPVTNIMAVQDFAGEFKALQSGANVVMSNVAE
ncbi:MAG: [FeFe] hydrogenase H-cluster radical SAM maturase HydE [Pelosinus sp.]|nr:[FeFe] hydrogenase H-cluster radical SAM maturase HydE [Pelosinus sp.]